MRHTRRVTLRSDSRRCKKGDTPVKTTLRRREKVKRLVSGKHECPTLPEEPEEDLNETTVKPAGQVRAVSVRCRFVSRLSSPATSVKTRSRAAPSVTPANKKPGHLNVPRTAYRTFDVTPIVKAFEDDDTPDSVISCSMEPDSTLNSEDDDDDNHCLSSSSTLNSLPSPEIFRKESSVATTAFPNKNELLSINLPIKNSTLLESSRATNIYLHHPPDLSVIIGDAMNRSKKNCEISHQKIPENRSKIDSDCSPKRKTPSKLTRRELILCKKKVWFQSPITAEMFKPEHSPPSSSATQSTTESPSQMKPAPEASKTGELGSKSETSPLLGTLKQPVTRSSAMFFDFGSDSERDAFFQRMRERSDELRSFVAFPSRLDTQTPLPCDC